MSSLTAADKLYLENILAMGGGYVLKFSDATFQQLFHRYSVDIHGDRYQTYGRSKAKKMQAFWEKESDTLVAQVLSEMVDTYEALCDSGSYERDAVALGKSREVVARLSGKPLDDNSAADDGFLSREFEMPSIQKLPVDFVVAQIIEERLQELQITLSNQAYLSAIFLCGSVLEGVLLGAALQQPERFNRSNSSPKSRDGKVKQFPDWSLSEFINVAHDIGLLKPDVQKFSYGLRDFRNYIHPYQQMESRFKPDEHTAKLCFQVLKAALADVVGDR